MFLWWGRNIAFLFLTCTKSHIKIAPSNRFAHIWTTNLLQPVIWGSLVRTAALVNIERFFTFFYPSFLILRKLQLVEKSWLLCLSHLVIVQARDLFVLSGNDTFSPLSLTPWDGYAIDNCISVSKIFVRWTDSIFYLSED
jgi:hypothetical protein